MNYIVLVRDEDEPYISELSADRLKELLKEDWNSYKFLEASDFELARFPTCSLLIVQGEVIIPKPVSTVTEYKL